LVLCEIDQHEVRSIVPLICRGSQLHGASSSYSTGSSRDDGLHDLTSDFYL